MYLGIDIGGTKTLAAVFDIKGNIQAEHRFPTSHNYEEFIEIARKAIVKILPSDKILAACVAVPGLVDRERGLIHLVGNLPWGNARPIASDISVFIKDAPVYIENDANLAGLSEARHVPKYRRVLYVTVSTGIGGGIIFDGLIEPGLQDCELGHMLFEFEGKPAEWEAFASGRAIVARYGKYAAEITDSKTWELIAKDLGWGLSAACAMLQLDAIIFGGGVGVYFDRFAGYLTDFLDNNLHQVIRRPELLRAQQPEKAVLYGCYELAVSKR